MTAPVLGPPTTARLLRLACLLTGLASGSPTWAADEDREYSAESVARPADMPLAPLPDPPERELPAPRPQALEAIDGILSRLVSQDPVVMERASRELYEAKVDWVGGIARRIDALAERADRLAMKKLLEGVRSSARSELSGENATPDYLMVLLQSSRRGEPGEADLVQLLGMARMLRAIETTAAARELIDIYVRFGEFMRIDVQRMLAELGDRATPALIEAERHPAQKIASWAARQLDLRGKAIAHEAVRTEDDQALADILVALGSTRDPDAARILISFAGTERAQIRLAARQGIALLGEVSAWTLRDAYQETTGRKPPRDWTWKRTARELFTEFDRVRLAQVYTLYEQAKAARAAGKLEEMRAAYDHILTLSPLFDQRAEMAIDYLSAAEAEGTPPQEALLAARRALRITSDAEVKKRAESLIRTLTAEELRRQGLFDRSLLDRAISLDPRNSAAQRQRETGGQAESLRLSPLARYGGAFAICALALVGAGWILWTSRRADQKTPTKAP